MPSEPSQAPERVSEVSDGGVASSDDRLAAGLRGFGPLGLLAILVNLAGQALLAPLGAILVLAWAWRSGTPWREIGYVWPRSWTRTVVVGITLGIAFKFLMKSIIMPLLGAPPDQSGVPLPGRQSGRAPRAIYTLTGPDLDTDDRARRIRPDRAVDDLLESGVLGRAPGVQGRVVMPCVHGATTSRSPLHRLRPAMTPGSSDGARWPNVLDGMWGRV